VTFDGVETADGAYDNSVFGDAPKGAVVLTGLGVFFGCATEGSVSVVDGLSMMRSFGGEMSEGSSFRGGSPVHGRPLLEFFC